MMLKTASLGTSNNMSPRSHKNHIIFVKLSTKNPTIFEPKLGINCPLGQRQRVIRNSHTVYNRTIHLYFLDTKFQVLGFAVLDFTLNKRPLFFDSGSNRAPILWGFGAIAAVKSVSLS